MAEGTNGSDKDTRQVWEDVSDRFSDLGRRIGEHYRKLGDDAGAAAAEQRRALGETIRKVVDQLDQAFTSAGNALRDPETTESMSRAARSLGSALETTFSKLGRDIDRRIRGKGSGGGTPPSGSSG